MSHEGRIEQTFIAAGQPSDETLVIDKSFNLTIQGLFAGAIYLQRRPKGSDLSFDFATVRTFVGEFEGIDSQGGEFFEYRLLTSLDFSGTAIVRLSRSLIGGEGGNIFERQGGESTASTVTIDGEVEIKNDLGNPIAVQEVEPQDQPLTFEFRDRITVSDSSLEVVAASAADSREVTVHVPFDQQNHVHINVGGPASRTKPKLQPGGTWQGVTKQSVGLIAGGLTEGGIGIVTTPDESPFGHDGLLVGTVLPNLVASPWAGFGNALNFDGVDLDDLSSGVNLGTSQDFALRGQTGRSYEAAVRSMGPASLWRMNETSGDMIDQMPAQPYAPKVTQHAATDRGTYSAAVLALAGLQSYWKMGEAAGDVLDSGPAAVPGVVSGSVTREVAALINPSRAAGDKALQLTGGSVNFGNTAHRLAGTQAFWIRRIVQLAVGSGAGPMTCEQGVSPTQSGWSFAFGAGLSGVRSVVCRRFSGLFTQITATIPDDGLPHVVDWIYSVALLTQVLYIDGAVVATVPDATSLVASTADLVLTGADAVQDDVFISYNSVGAGPVAALYSDATTERFSGGVSSYWRLGEAAGDFADSGPAGLPGVGSGLTRAVASVVTPAQTGGDLAVGGGGSVDFGRVYQFTGREPFSAEMWITRPSTLIGYTALACLEGSALSNWFLGIQTNAALTQDLLQFIRGFGEDTFDAIFIPTTQFDFTLPQNQRLHIVGTYDGTTMILYAQGVEIGRTVSTTNITAGGDRLTLLLDVTTKADDIAIYPGIALTAAQVQEHFTYGSSKIGACNGVVSGSVTRNVASLVHRQQNNPYDDALGALSLNDISARVNFGDESYRLAGRQQFSIVQRVKLAVGAGAIILYAYAADGWRVLVDAPLSGQRLIRVDRLEDGFGDPPYATLDDDGLAHTVVVTYDGAQLATYIDGALANTVASTRAMGLDYVSGMNLGREGALVAVADDLAIFLRALTPAEVLALHTEATVWDGKKPKTFDVRVRPDTLHAGTAAARVAGSLDWAIETTPAGVFDFLYVNAVGALVSILGGAYAAASSKILRLVDDRTEVLAYVDNVLIGSSLVRPAQTTVAEACYAGRNGIGSPTNINPKTFDGIIDEFRVSNIVRTDAGAAPYTVDANTLALFHFDTLDSSVGVTQAPDVQVEVIVGEPE